jgi:phosphotransferase system  glucose/maltose/N-acetylglucosamine-specific IIC component
MSEDNLDPIENTSPASDQQTVEERLMTSSTLQEQQEAAEAQKSQELLPPEAQGEVNGGPLGCCLGVAVGLVISLSVAVMGRIYANALLPVFHSPSLILILLRIVMVICGIAGAIIFGYLGWKIGKRLYREYEPPVVQYRRYKKPKIKEVRTNL